MRALPSFTAYVFFTTHQSEEETWSHVSANLQNTFELTEFEDSTCHEMTESHKCWLSFRVSEQEVLKYT